MKQRYAFRILSMLLAFVLVFELFPTGALAQDAGTGETDATTAREVAEGEAGGTVLGEVTEYRDEREKHFRMEDGSFIAVDYGVPVHYALDEETWVDIDNTLVLQSSSASTASVTAAQSAQNPQQYTAVNGDDTKTFAGNLSTGFLFSAQRGQTGVRMSLMDGGTEPTEPELTEPAAEATAEATEPEEAAEPAAEPEASTEALPITEPEETMPETEPATEPTEETLEEIQAEASAQLPVDTADGTEADSTLPAVADSETEEETYPAESQNSETIAETSPEAEPETLPETEPETIPETEPETTPETNSMEASEPVQENTLEPFNRSAAAKISYPDQKEASSTGFSALFAAVQSLFEGDADHEEPSLTQQITPSRLRTQVLYENVFPGVDLQYELYSYNVKESIIVKEPLSTYTFAFRLGLRDLTPVLQEDGSVLLLDGDENLCYRIPAPYMTDANGAYSEAASYQLSQQADGTWVLTVTADAGWIESPERAFPVCIDPTLIDETTSKSFVGTVCTEASNSVSATTNLACGYHPDYGKMEIYYKLTDLPKIPAGHTLVRAQAGFLQNDYRSGANSTSGTMVLYMSEITQNATLNSSLTWANRPAHGPTLDYVNSSYSTINDILLWDVTPAAKKWYEGGSNYGLVMTSNADSSSKNRTWFSYNSKVYFVASYRSTNGIEDYYTYQTMGVGNAGTAYIGDFSGQLTLCKNLVSYASTVNPVSLDLVYNSSYAMRYGEENYDTGGWLGLGMHVGAGVNLSVMQKVEKIELQNDSNASNKSTYMKYTDGDGTIHYFAKDSSKDADYYYDEDGMQLKINEYRTGCYMISDDKDNEMYFVNGYLTLINDANGNEIQIHYVHSDGTSASNGYPNASGDRISKIVQKNNGGSAITVATFAYSSANWLTSVTDAAGNVYKLTYSGGKLSQISRGSTVLAQYGAASTRMSYAYDAEAKYGVAFTYSAGKVGSYYEITSASTASKPGAIVEVGHLENGQTLYRDYGSDRIKNDNDILTYYTFDYAGRSANAYTTDTANRIWGASNAVHSGVGSTDKANNRTLRTSTIGVAAMNELRNHGFELSSPAWQLAAGGGGSAELQSTTVRTGTKAFHAKVGDKTTGTTGAKQTTNTLSAGVTYTLSAYVNTSKCTSFLGRGVYLQVLDGSSVVATSECLNYATNSNIDSGWVQLSLPFTPPTKKAYTVCVYTHCVGGDIYVDDFQLECSDTPSNLNLLENGNLQYWGYGWTMGPLAGYYEGHGLFSESQYAYSIQVGGDAYTESCAYQDVPINKSGKTFVMSGWAKANAVPDNKQTATGDDAAAKDKHKQFGLRAIVTYSDNTTEYHYVPFNPDITDWQYVSTAIVPKKETTVIKTIRVVCAYERNGNTAYFDNLSLTEEAAQTMKYDKDGNLVSVKSSGSSEESSTYSGGNLKSLKTGSDGTFTYTYDSNHNLKTATNGIVTETMTYDSSGNALTATISPKSGTDKIVTTNTYTNSNNQLSTVKQRGQYTTTYSYAGSANKMYGLASSVVDPQGLTVSTGYDAAGRPTSSSVSKSGSTLGSVSYQYANGMLKTLSRTTGSSTQSYNFTYDSFGNMKTLKVGGRTLAEYTYGDKNGQLERQTYGNGDYTSFQYDNLNRTTGTTTSSGDSYHYSYAGDGQLHKMEDTAAGVTYRYNYDAIGRLIGTSQTGGAADLRAAYGYDNESRLKSINYSIPGVVDSATQSFYYNTSTTDSISDGVLTSMALFSNSWLYYRYDSLSRLKERDVGNILTEHQTYLAGSGTCTTTTLPETFYTTARGSTAKLSGYRYSYNEVGNVTQITNLVDGTYWKFAYDKLGQMQYATDYAADGTARDRYYYYYDNAGNLTSREIRDGTGSITGVEHTYTYGDTNWKDLLTAFDGHSITYDSGGNPLSYYNGRAYTLSWRNGRELDSATVGGKTYRYEYDVNGVRTRKSNADGGYTQYYLIDGKAVAEQRFNSSGVELYTLRYSLDENNSPVGFAIQYPSETAWTNYYFAKNLQGDVIALYRSDYNYSTSSYYGTLVATYEYDPWGKPIGIYNAGGILISETAANVAAYNPFRYRGYRYDADTGFYYLQSRYYDPAICRFINADAYNDTGNGILGYNMFAYCLNNPTMYADNGGTWPSLSQVFAAVAVAAATVAVVAACVATAGAAAPALLTVAGTVINTTAVAGAAAAVASEAAVVAGAAFTAAAVAKKTEQLKSSYTVYFLQDDAGTIQYVGRVKDSGFKKRMAYHEATRGLTVKYAYHGLTYAEARGLEEIGMVECHTINKSNPENNQIHGISGKNKNAGRYIDAALGYLGNKAENTLLNLLIW